MKSVISQAAKLSRPFLSISTNVCPRLEPFVKYEAPYDLENTPNAFPQSSRKRRSSDQESPEKRQRIDEDDSLVTPEFAAFVSQTAVAAGQTSNGSMATRILEEEPAYLGLDGPAESDFVYDPYYNMRILSLPILESLVSRAGVFSDPNALS